MCNSAKGDVVRAATDREYFHHWLIVKSIKCQNWRLEKASFCQTDNQKNLKTLHLQSYMTSKSSKFSHIKTLETSKMFWLFLLDKWPKKTINRLSKSSLESSHRRSCSCHSFIVRKKRKYSSKKTQLILFGSRAKKKKVHSSVFFFFYFLHASLMYRHESNDFFVCFFFFF